MPTSETLVPHGDAAPRLLSELGGIVHGAQARSPPPPVHVVSKGLSLERAVLETSYIESWCVINLTSVQ